VLQAGGHRFDPGWLHSKNPCKLRDFCCAEIGGDATKSSQAGALDRHQIVDDLQPHAPGRRVGVVAVGSAGKRLVVPCRVRVELRDELVVQYVAETGLLGAEVDRLQQISVEELRASNFDAADSRRLPVASMPPPAS
jgi:hypothetical protein